MKQLEQEPPHEIPDRKPPASWPADGRIELKDVVLKYRPELPPVLKGLSMSVKPGEKIGIVGRSVLNRSWSGLFAHSVIGPELERVPS